MRTEVIFQHGWGFDRTIWDSWCHALKLAASDSVQCVTGERGYFGGQPFTPGFSDKANRKVVVAHSLGLHLLPSSTLAQANLILCLASFVGFHPPDPTEHKRSRRTIQAMRSKLSQAPHTVLNDFLRNCYSPEEFYPALTGIEFLELNRLQEDLNILDDNRLDVKALTAGAPVVILHGTRDEIVSKDAAFTLHELIPQSKIQLIPSAGHAFPFVQMDSCLPIIKDVMDTQPETRYTNVSATDS